MTQILYNPADLTAGFSFAFISDMATAQPRRRIGVYFIVVAIGLAVAVGLSRIYVGVHYPSDVAAGWAAGLAWACLCYVGFRLGHVWFRWRSRRANRTAPATA